MPDSIRSVKFESDLARRKRRAFTIRMSALCIFIAAVFLFCVYWLFLSPSFRIEEVNITGIDGVLREAVQEHVNAARSKVWFGIMPSGRNLLLFDRSALASKLLKELPELRTVTVFKKFPHTLKIDIVPRVPLGIWCRGELCMHFDETGTSFTRAYFSNGRPLLAVYDMRIQDGELIDRVYLDKIVRLSKLLGQSEIEIVKMDIPADGPNELLMYTSAGSTIKVAIDSDIAAQVYALKAFLEQKRSENSYFAPEYIDLRIPDRIYYR